MKLANALLSTIAALAVAGLASVSCSVPNKSGEYECSTQDDCAAYPGRTCQSGYCVLTGDPPTDGGLPPRIDAPPPPIDAPPADVCPAVCSTCDVEGKLCNIDCATEPGGCSNMALVCPAGWECDIKCNTNNACRMGVNCLNATACTIDCSGQGSCRQLISGPGPFDVTCSGQGSCRGLDCDPSCACDIACEQAADCEFIRCSSPVCGVLGGGCTSERTGCDTCP